jgi:hypothetical protein
LGGAALVFLMFFASASTALAAEKEPVSIKGDQVEYFDTLGKVVATGNVEAVYQDSKLTCDRATIYMQTKDAYLEGRVRLIQPDGLLKGEEILYNFETRKGTILEAEGEAGEWRSKGDRADKISPDSYIHRGGGYLTSCNFEQPHTRMRAREVRVFLDDKVVLKDVVMQVGSVPVFYLPSYTHLLDDKRPRVTIIPGKDKQWGLFLLTSWRVYLNENLQGRFHVDFRERMDLATGFDLNYRLPVGGRGIFRNYYTHQRDLHREHFWSNSYGSDKGDPTTEKERSRFQLRHLWEVDDTAKVTLEYNRAQDPTVVKDFFEREFEENTSSATTYFQFIKTSPWFGLSFLVNKRVNRFETVTQSLPSIQLGLRPFDLPWLPGLDGLINRLERRPVQTEGVALASWSYLSSYQYEHSNVADKINGTEASLLKLDSTHEVFHPMRLLRRLNFRPFFRFRQSSFSRGKTDFSPQFRQAGAVGFDLNSKLFRVFDLNTDLWNLNIHRLRHVITPNLNYLYQAQPTINPDKLLRADGLAKSNVITPSLEQKLQTKRSDLAGARTDDLARFTASMPYDLEGAGGIGGSWQSVSMDLETLPYPWLRIESDGQIDPHIGKFSTINADLVVHPGFEKGWSGRSIGEITEEETGEEKELPWAVGLGWRYQRNSSAQLTFETEFNLGQKWRAGIYQGFDVKRFVTETTVLESRTVKKIYTSPEFEYRLRRDLHEWTVELLYNVRRGQGETVLVLFRLKAAPELPFEFERSYHRPKAGRNFQRK